MSVLVAATKSHLLDFYVCGSKKGKLLALRMNSVRVN